MLSALHIRDFVIVEQAEISFEPGFTVFSGETGAGKSILIDALSLALGARGDAGQIRENASSADISAVFHAPGPALAWLAGQDIEGPEIILRRRMDNQGRSKAWVNGQPVTLTQLRELAGLLLDIHGQHAHQGLLMPATQRELFDSHGGHQALALSVQEAWQEWRKAEDTLEQARLDADRHASEIRRLEADAGFLDELDPQTDEWPQLCARQSRLAHAQSLMSNAAQAIEALDGESGSAAQALHGALQAIQSMQRHDPGLEEFSQSLESARILCAETVSGLNAYLDRIEPDPEALALADARMSRLFEAARRFGTEPENLPELHARLQEQLHMASARQDLAALELACNKAREKYHDLAMQLSQARQLTADRLSSQVTQAMQDLSMEGGSFVVGLTPCKPAAHGLETVGFLVAGHAGTSPRPLARVASGGELSRVSLALSVIASQAARVPTLIFDEVDAGIGGGVAEIIGQMLHRLAARHQVLCVTHLPQVAACADHHYQVYKSSDSGHTRSGVQVLSHEARTHELARMLGGLNITATTLEHAREMLLAAHTDSKATGVPPA